MTVIENPESSLPGKLRGLHLFHFDGAPCAQRVRFALGEKGLARGREVAWNSDDAAGLVAEEGTWTSRHVSLIKKDHLTAEYAAIHPHMVVPALVHDGVLHIESMDIVKYLDQIFPANPLVPTDAAAAELAMSLVEQGKELHRSVRYVSFHWGLGRLAKLNSKEQAHLAELEKEGSPERLTSFYKKFSSNSIEAATNLEHLQALEAGYGRAEELLGDGRPFLTGSSFSIADIIWSIKVLRIHECGYPFKRNFPALFDWYRRVSRRPAFRTSVMGKHRAMSLAFRLKARIERLAGVGIHKAAAA